MPYIPLASRAHFAATLDALCADTIHATDGEMNYVITSLLLAHITHGNTIQARYADYEAAIGLLECIKLEFYRRAVAPYEDAAVARNGDVF